AEWNGGRSNRSKRRAEVRQERTNVVNYKECGVLIKDKRSDTQGDGSSHHWTPADTASQERDYCQHKYRDNTCPAAIIELKDESADDEDSHPQHRTIGEIIEKKESNREPYELIRKENHLDALNVDLL